MTAVLETSGLSKRFGRRWALQDCTLAIPEGKVVGLVGPNGAGKTTLLHLAVGLLAPTTGTVTVLGGHPGDGPTQLGRVGFVAQDTGHDTGPWRTVVTWASGTSQRPTRTAVSQRLSRSWASPTAARTTSRRW